MGDIDSTARSRYNIPDRVKGALITDVAPDSASYDAGLRPGDVIQEIDHKRVANAEEAVEVSKHVKTKQVHKMHETFNGKTFQSVVFQG